MTDGQRVHVQKKQRGKRVNVADHLVLLLFRFLWSSWFNWVISDWGQSSEWSTRPMRFGDFWLKALHCVANKILIVYQIEDESSYKQVVKRKYCPPKSCKHWALWMGGAVSCAPCWFSAEWATFNWRSYSV